MVRTELKYINLTLEHSQSFSENETTVSGHALPHSRNCFSTVKSTRIAAGSRSSEQHVPVSKFPVDPRSR